MPSSCFANKMAKVWLFLFTAISLSLNHFHVMDPNYPTRQS